MQELVLQQSFTLLAKFFIRGKSRNPVTYGMKLSAKIARGFKIWNSDMVELVNRTVFIRFQCFVVVQVLFNTIIKKPLLPPIQNCFKKLLYYKHSNALVALLVNRLTFSSRK